MRPARLAQVEAVIVLAAAASARSQPCPSLTRLEDPPWEFSPYPARALDIFDVDGPGPGPGRLVAAGPFTQAGGVSASGFAAWDGQGWAAVQASPAGLRAPMSVVGGAGGLLYVAGSGAELYRFDGEVWSAVPVPGHGGSPAASVMALAPIDPDGVGPLPESLHAAVVNVDAVVAVFRLDGGAWAPLGAPSSIFGTTSGAGLAGYDADGAGPGPVEVYLYRNAAFELTPNHWYYWTAIDRLSGVGWTRISDHE